MTLGNSSISYSLVILNRRVDQYRDAAWVCDKRSEKGEKSVEKKIDKNNNEK